MALLNEADSIRLGVEEPSAVYLGSNLVWSSGPDLPVPLAAYEFNEGSGTQAYDSMGNYPSFQNLVDMAWGSGTAAARMTSSSNPATTISPDNNWSVACRGKLFSIGGYKYFYEVNTAGTGKVYFWFDSGKIAMYHETANATASTASLVDNTFSTCVWVNDAAANQHRLYVGGVLKATTVAILDRPNRGHGIILNATPGEIDWLRTYAFVLTDPQIALLSETG